MNSFEFRRYYIKVKDFLLGSKNKEFLIFLFFFFVSAAFWLLQSLNETLDVEMKVPLRLANVPSDVVITSELPPEVDVTVRDKGTVLVRYLYGMERPPVSVDYGEYADGTSAGSVAVPSADLLKKVQAQLLSSTRIVSVRPDTLEYFFCQGTRKKVPVRLAGVVNTTPEYYLKQVLFSPDSVEVLAPPAILDTIMEVSVMPLHLEGLSANTAVACNLHHLRGVKMVPDRVTMNVLVDLYTEKTVEVPVVGVNFPANKELRTFPSKVNVVFRVGMSGFKAVTASDFVLAVSYEELLENESPKIRLRLRSVPPGVSNVRIEPQEVDYLIEQTQEE